MCIYIYIYIYISINNHVLGKVIKKKKCFQEITSALEIPPLREEAWGDWYSTTPAIVH